MSRYTTIKVQRGNDFELHMKPVMLNGRLVSASELTDISVMVYGKDDFELVPEFEVRDRILAVKFNDSMELGLYDVVVHAKWQGNDIEDARRSLIEIVKWTDGIQFTTYKQDLVLIGTTTDDMDALRQRYEQAIQDAAEAKAEAAAVKAEYLDKMAALEGTAREQSVSEVKATLATKANEATLLLAAKEESVTAVREYLKTLGKEETLGRIAEYQLSLGKELTLKEIKTLLGTKANEETLLHAAKEASIDEVKATLAALMTYASQIKSVVDEINTRTSGMDVKVDTINSNTTSTKGKVGEVDVKVNLLSDHIDDFKSTIDEHCHDIEAAVADGNALCAGIDVKVDTINTNTSNTKGKVYELDNKTAVLSGNVDDNKKDTDKKLVAIKAVVDEINGRLSE